MGLCAPNASEFRHIYIHTRMHTYRHTYIHAACESNASDFMILLYMFLVSMYDSSVNILYLPQGKLYMDLCAPSASDFTTLPYISLVSICDYSFLNRNIGGNYGLVCA
jgi:hypothetical protein